MQLFPVGKVFDFMRQRRWMVGMSLLMVLGSIVVLIKPGPHLGTDFLGGTEVEVAFKKATSSGEIRDAVTRSGFAQPDIIKVDDPNNAYRYLIRVQDVTTIDTAQQGRIERALCYGDNLPQAECPKEREATEVKFSPGGDKITVRFDETPDLAWVRQQMAKVSGVQLRPGENRTSALL